MNNKTVNARLSRRKFIQLSGMTSIAFLTPGVFSAGNQFNKPTGGVSFPKQYLPVIGKCDILIVGGGFAGVSAALEFSKKGLSVVLLERRIYLGREITSTYRPWVTHDSESRNHLPELDIVH